MYKSYKGGNLPDLGIVGIEGQVEVSATNSFLSLE